MRKLAVLVICFWITTNAGAAPVREPKISYVQSLSKRCGLAVARVFGRFSRSQFSQRPEEIYRADRFVTSLGVRGLKQLLQTDVAVLGAGALEGYGPEEQRFEVRFPREWGFAGTRIRFQINLVYAPNGVTVNFSQLGYSAPPYFSRNISEVRATAATVRRQLFAKIGKTNSQETEYGFSDDIRIGIDRAPEAIAELCRILEKSPAIYLSEY